MLVRRVIGYVPQMLSADANLTALENVELFARLFDVPRRARAERVAGALTAMGLTEAAGRLAGTYSGGMIRRLELAQALVNAPRLLVLDELPYLAYLAPDILAQSALFIAIFYGIQIIWERDAGVLTKLMVTPTPRSALITGKAFAAGVRSLIQGVVVVIIAALLGVALTANPLKLFAAAIIVVLGSAFFSCLSMSIAAVALARDRLMGIPPPPPPPPPPHERKTTGACARVYRFRHISSSRDNLWYATTTCGTWRPISRPLCPVSMVVAYHKRSRRTTSEQRPAAGRSTKRA